MFTISTLRAGVAGALITTLAATATACGSAAAGSEDVPDISEPFEEVTRIYPPTDVPRIYPPTDLPDRAVPTDRTG